MSTRTNGLTTLALGVELEMLSFCSCGISHAMPSIYVNERRADHKSFYCPNGHAQHFPSQTQEEQLRKCLANANKEIEYQRERASTANANAKHFEARANGYKGQAAKLKRRAAAGLCGFCSRTFANVSEHVKTEHPAEHEAARATAE